MNLLPIVNQLFSTLTILIQILIVAAVFYLFVYKKRIAIVDLVIARYGLLLAFSVAFISASTSLVYSEVVGLAPCLLCWYQRIFMYPMVLLLWMAAYKRDRGIIDYILGLSGMGGLIALYHYLLQIGAASSLSCSAVGYSVNCADTFQMSYGYITIPMMSFTAFALIFVLMLALKRK